MSMVDKVLEDKEVCVHSTLFTLAGGRGGRTHNEDKSCTEGKQPHPIDIYL